LTTYGKFSGGGELTRKSWGWVARLIIKKAGGLCPKSGRAILHKGGGGGGAEIKVRPPRGERSTLEGGQKKKSLDWKKGGWPPEGVSTGEEGEMSGGGGGVLKNYKKTACVGYQNNTRRGKQKCGKRKSGV